MHKLFESNMLTAFFGAILAVASTVHAGEIRIRAGALVNGPVITLGDVADLEGADAQSLANLEVAQAGTRDEVMVRLADVRGLLADRDINWGSLTLSGYSRCIVEVQQANVKAQPTVDTLPAPKVSRAARVERAMRDHAARTAVTANGRHAMSVDRPFAVRDRIIEMIAKANRTTADQLEIEFTRGDDDLLVTPLAAISCEMNPLSTNTLGRVVFEVNVWEDDGRIREHRITASVARRYVAVVARRSISRGDRISRGDVEMRDVLIDRDGDPPLTVLGDVVGKVAASILRPGTVVTSRRVEAPLLVKRGEVVVVHAKVGSYLIRMEGRAKADGAMGETITVERNREEISVRVVGRRQVSCDVGKRVSLEGKDE